MYLLCYIIIHIALAINRTPLNGMLTGLAIAFLFFTSKDVWFCTVTVYLGICTRFDPQIHDFMVPKMSKVKPRMKMEGIWENLNTTFFGTPNVSRG